MFLMLFLSHQLWSKARELFLLPERLTHELIIEQINLSINSN